MVKSRSNLRKARTAAAKADIIVHREEAESTLASREGGDPADKVAVLGSFQLQFGQYQGSTFKWLLENDLGYAVFL